MRKSLKAFIVASALAAGVAVAPALQAHEAQNPQGPTLGHGSMMGQGGMMTMMGQMSQMMKTCNKMMQGAMNKPGQAPEAQPQQQ